ncbi:MAG: protein-methionine-sulfoxide reductase catalytic subunit MsrP [Candidatus Tectimicrobiota bacterium]
MAPAIKIVPPWHIPESQVTPESLYWQRRQLLQRLGHGSLAMLGLLSGCYGNQESERQLQRQAQSLPKLVAPTNSSWTLDRPLTDEIVAAQHNNFYEFSRNKSDVWELAQFQTAPWTVQVGGLVHRPQTLDVDDLRTRMPLEERNYRFRCVEAWAMAVPWIGFPMRALLDRVEPMSSARFVRLTTLSVPTGNTSLFKQYPWPYNEGLSLAEAMHDLTLLAVGIYGHVLPPQHGAPLRLVIPWKYGFKSIKSIVRIELTATQPATFWNTLAPHEYDFEANVNPSVPHPRWSQASERLLGSGERRPTLLYNGYEAHVAPLYRG